MKKIGAFSSLFAVDIKKKIFVLIGFVILIILAGAALVFFDRSEKSVGNEKTQSENLEGLADDSGATLLTEFQTYEAGTSGQKVKVYSENWGKQSSMAILDTCELEAENSEHAVVEIGDKTIEKPNHCILQFRGQSETAYILLPDNSLIAVSGNAVVQVNVFDRETRIVQTEGRAYYRVAKQPEGKKFSVQMGDKIFSATGTEIFAHANLIPMTDEIAEKSKEIDTAELSQEEINEMLAPNWRIGFGIIEGKGEIFTRGGEGEKLTASAGNYFGFDFQEYGKRETKKLAIGSVSDLTGAIKQLASDYNDRKSMYGNIVSILEGFVADQISISGKYYGIGNFPLLGGQKVAEILTAYLYDFSQLSEIQIKEAERESAEFYKEWARLSETYDGNSSSGSPSGTEGNVGQDSGGQSNSNSGSKDVPTYYYSDDTSDGISERCFSKGTASYQLFCGSSGGGKVVNGKCCIN